MASIEATGSDARGGPRWHLHLPQAEAALIVSLPAQLQAVLGDPDKNRRLVERLFPPSYDDADLERENRRLLGATLLDERRAMLADVAALLGRGRASPTGLRLTLDPASLDALLRFLNDVRLLLATELGVEKNLGEITIDAGHPDAARFSLLVYLGGLQAALVGAVMGG